MDEYAKREAETYIRLLYGIPETARTMGLSCLGDQCYLECAYEDGWRTSYGASRDMITTPAIPDYPAEVHDRFVAAGWA